MYVLGSHKHCTFPTSLVLNVKFHAIVTTITQSFINFWQAVLEQVAQLFVESCMVGQFWPKYEWKTINIVGARKTQALLFLHDIQIMVESQQ